MKKINIIGMCTILISIIIVGLFFLFIVSGAVFMLMPTPPEPEIKYGEFSIKIIYEVNGEKKELTDTIICEFDGFENHGSGGIWRKWISYLKSGNERLVLLKGEDDNGIKYEISDFYGVPEYYMGDFYDNITLYEKSLKYDNEFGYIQWKDGIRSGKVITKDEAFEKYKLQIIDIQYSKPIQNQFK